MNLAAVAASIANGHQNFNFAGCCLASQKYGTHKQFSGQVRLLSPPSSRASDSGRCDGPERPVTDEP